MAFQPVPNTARFRFLLDYVSAPDNNNAMFDIYVGKDPGGWTQVTVGQRTSTMFNWWMTEHRGKYTGLWHLRQIVGRNLEDEFALDMPYTLTEAEGTGQRAGEGPSGLAVKMDFKTSPGSIPKRGGPFLPAGGDNDHNGNYWDQTFLDDIKQDFDALIALFPADEDLVIVSRFIGDVPRDPAIATTLLSYAPRPKIAFQRPRMRN